MNDSAHGLEERRHKAAEGLLRLISREELGKLATQLAADEVSAESVASRLALLPRFQALGIALSLAEPTVRMLRDVLSYLERRGVAARTTGCALLLADPVQGQQHRIDLTPQEVGALASWTPKSKRGLRDDFFHEALSDWRTLSAGWRRLLQRARPRIEQGEIDVVETYINAQTYIKTRTGSPSIVYEPDRDLSDSSAQGVLAALVKRVEQLVDLLDQLPPSERPPACETLLRDMRQLIAVAERDVLGPRSSSGRNRRHQRALALPEPDRRHLLRYVDERFLQTFDRLAEDLYLLADLVAGDRLFDILSVNIWTSRPQLYEVWILVTVLSWLEARGYRVELLKIEQRTDGTSEWRLAYAKDSTPCARVHGGLLKGAAVFYQLYRASGDMPDLCLIPDATSQGKPSWVIDPKHSEKGGYTMSDYRATALRYHESFGAEVCVIVEYFPRADVAEPAQNPLHFGPGAVLIRDASPSGSGLSVMLDLLGALYPRLGSAILCIDVSVSFRSHVEDVLRRTKEKLRMEAVGTLDTFVWFAERATTGTGMKAFMDGDASTLSDLGSSAALGDGTHLPPLVAELRRLTADGKISEIILVSDGSFTDAPNALDLLSAEFSIPVRLYS